MRGQSREQELTPSETPFQKRATYRFLPVNLRPRRHGRQCDLARNAHQEA